MMLRSVRWIVGRPLVPRMIEKLAMCGEEHAIGGRSPGPVVAELARERLAEARDHRRFLLGDLLQPGIGEERVPLPIARQRREREPVALLRNHRRLELEAREGAE